MTDSSPPRSDTDPSSDHPSRRDPVSGWVADVVAVAVTEPVKAAVREALREERAAGGSVTAGDTPDTRWGDDRSPDTGRSPDADDIRSRGRRLARTALVGGVLVGLAALLRRRRRDDDDRDSDDRDDATPTTEITDRSEEHEAETVEGRLG